MMSDHRNPKAALSPDRTILTIEYCDGYQATFETDKPEGFTDTQVDVARRLDRTVTLPGQHDRARRITVRGHAIYLHINTGPPTWWVPRIEVTRKSTRPRSLMAGWLRGLIAASWAPIEHDSPHHPTEGHLR